MLSNFSKAHTTGRRAWYYEALIIRKRLHNLKSIQVIIGDKRPDYLKL